MSDKYNFNPYGIIPFVRIFIPLALGIVLFNFYPSFNVIVPFLTTLCFILLFFFHFIVTAYFKPVLLRWWGVGLNITLFMFGFSLCQIKYPFDKHEVDLSSKKLILAEVQSNPEIKTSHVKLSVRFKSVKINDTWFAFDKNGLLYVPKDSNAINLRAGDNIAVYSKLQSPSNNGNPNEFDYKHYLMYNQISYTAYAAANEWKKLTGERTFNIMYLASRLQHTFVHTLNRLGLTDDVLSISSAIVVGYRNEVDPEIKQAYMSAGATHLLAVSGMNVGIIYLVIDYLLFFLKRNKRQLWLKMILTLALLWFYAAVTGFSASVLRATVMFSFIVVSKHINRKANLYNTLAASAVFLLLFNPFLLFDVGFQLSYVALIGIVYLQPKLKNLLYVKNKVLNTLWELVCVTLAAQIVTTPLSLYYFHQFPTYFMISGIVLVPVNSLVNYLAIFCLCISWLPLVSTVLAFVLKWLVIFMNSVVLFIESLPGSTIQNIYLDKIQLVLIYLFIFTLVLFFVHKKITYLRWSLIMIILYSTSILYYEAKTVHQKKIYVYNIKGSSVLDLIDGHQNVLILSDSISDKILYAVKGNWLALKVSKSNIIPFSHLVDTAQHQTKYPQQTLFVQNNFLNFYGYKIMIINDSRFNNTEIQNSINVDMILLQHYANVNLSELLKKVHTRQIVIDSSCPLAKANKWLAQLQSQPVKIHVCKQQGAWSCNIKDECNTDLLTSSLKQFTSLLF